MHLLYDVAHNIAKIEEHAVGTTQEECLRAPQGGDPRLSPPAITTSPNATAASGSL